MTKYQLHVEIWKDCGACRLCELRNRVVLARGKIPCDVLFVGEAPGESENSIGKPFIGPAGTLLDKIVEKTVDRFGLRTAFTNIIACIPYDEEGHKVEQPEEDHIEACKPRLIEFVELAQPKLVVAVGKVAEDWLTPGFQHSVKFSYKPKVITIMHPAAILRSNITMQSLHAQRCKIAISEALEELTAQ